MSLSLEVRSEIDPVMVPKDIFLPQNGAENGLIGLADGRKVHAKREFRTLKLAQYREQQQPTADLTPLPGFALLKRS